MADAEGVKYKRGAVKVSDTAVAIKRDDGSGPMSWAVMTIDNGGHYGSYAEVADWKDV
ncbi:Uncharacterised protein [Mycobacteroides abscessus subsp. abscessus]|uniref:hypothetical protein n=1 Tax=Mycobacteroides abscessus TaxID=36809 RepID=UPI0009291E6A|nr:hypothetical protein [Mycobacteroides abscessus]SIL71633.1 Uncharacterised protein [Mycobacteroides abscessus subsp. abscessus]